MLGIASYTIDGESFVICELEDKEHVNKRKMLFKYSVTDLMSVDLFDYDTCENKLLNDFFKADSPICIRPELYKHIVNNLFDNYDRNENNINRFVNYVEVKFLPEQ